MRLLPILLFLSFLCQAGSRPPHPATSPDATCTGSLLKSDSDLAAVERLDDDLQDLRRERDQEQATGGVNTSGRENNTFRDYANAPHHVKEFYLLQHAEQTLAVATRKHSQFSQLNHHVMGIWEVLEYLNRIVDESDPDIDLSQIQHALQTAQGIRKKYPDPKYDWFVLVGLIHDLGKILATYGEPQWAVVGDTFPLGMPFSNKIVYPGSFALNSDLNVPEFQRPLGIYREGIGLDNVLMSWGHDEYLYQVLKNQSSLPAEALFIIRYHSFYPLHAEGAYRELLNDSDRKLLTWLKRFQAFDLYTKDPDLELDPKKVKAYYQELIHKYIPGEIRF